MFSKSTNNIISLYSNESKPKEPLSFQDHYKNLKKPPPLINLGANCYLNSTLQSISSSENFVEDITKLFKLYNNLEKLSMFYELINVLYNGSPNRMEISRNPLFKNWNKPGQQDSFELLSYILNQIYNEIRQYKEDQTNISKRNMQDWLQTALPLTIIIEYEIYCECGNVITGPRQTDIALHLSIPKEHNVELQDLVDGFFKESLITNYACEKQYCRRKNASGKMKLLKPLPRTICIHLQKSRWDGSKMTKIYNKIIFSHLLKIKPCFLANKHRVDINLWNFDDVTPDSDIISRSASHCSNLRNKFNMEDGNLGYTIGTGTKELKLDYPVKEDDFDTFNEDDKEYSLCSVIVHCGSQRGGHYICYKRVGNNWFLTSDCKITSIKEEQVFKCDAYMLFYDQLVKQR